MTMTREEETTIGKTSKLTLGLVIVIVALLIGGAGTTITVIITYTNARHADREENRKGREEILGAIQELKDSQLAYQMSTDEKIKDIQEKADAASQDLWPASAMKIWVLESQKAGHLVDPDPIIDRYVKP